MKSQGVSGIDYWFVSHLDQDHISGLEEAAESGYPIRQVIFAEGVLKDEAYRKLTDKLMAQQVEVMHVEKGSSVRGKNACFYVLAPNADEASDDRNARSLVLMYEDNGFRGFFPGDISANEEHALVQAGNLPQISFYKAAHHGSKYSNSEEILRQLKPCISVVSCARNNRYGHPGEEAVAHMEANSMQVCYTMHAGQVRIQMEHGRMKVQQKIIDTQARL